MSTNEDVSSSSSSSSSSTTIIPVKLKWSKKVFDDIHICPGDSGIVLKEKVQEITGVPITRQKLLAKGYWKGTLTNDYLFTKSPTEKIINKRKSSFLSVTLIGSAETLVEPNKMERKTTTFLEDLSPEQLQKAEQEKEEAAMSTAIGMIIPLQMPPHLRDDGKMHDVVYPYNRLVTGLPQRQIEKELQKQQQQNLQSLQGKVAMTAGLELRRAYVNDPTVLANGSLVSALDDGHVQIWRHGAQEHDVIHKGMPFRGVDSVIALNNNDDSVAFATAGRDYGMKMPKVY